MQYPNLETQLFTAPTHDAPVELEDNSHEHFDKTCPSNISSELFPASTQAADHGQVNRIEVICVTLIVVASFVNAAVSVLS